MPPVLPLLLAFAGPLSARIAADPTTVTVGDELQIVLEVERQGSGKVPEPTLSQDKLEGFDVGFCAPGTVRRMSTFGGMQRIEQLTCNLTAKKTGKHKLAFAVAEGGTTIRSNTIVIDVREATQVVVTDPTLGEPTEAAGDVFLWASTDKVSAYVGEQVTYRLDVYEGTPFVEPQMRTSPSFQDFFAEELPLPQLRIAVIQGRDYRVRPGMRRALFPQRAGTLAIGAATVDPGRGRDLQSIAIDIEVHPLPAEGQPPGFPSNNVGKYTIAASVDRDEVQPGEPFTLTVVVEGTGNIDVLEVGEWPKIPTVRAYEPKMESTNLDGDTIGGTRRYEFLFIPERSGKLTIPAHELPFFDPATGKYEVAKTEPLSVLVGGDPNSIIDESADASEASPSSGLAEPLASVIVLDGLPRRVPEERWLTDERWTWGMLAVPLFALLGLGGSALWRRLGPDESARDRARTRRRRRERIEEAQAAAASGEGFHTTIAKLLQEVALERTGGQGIGLPRPQVCRLLEQRGVAHDDVGRFQALLERCDEARFAGDTGSAGDRKSLLDDALAVIRSLTKGGGM